MYPNNHFSTEDKINQYLMRISNKMIIKMYTTTQISKKTK